MNFFRVAASVAAATLVGVLASSSMAFAGTASPAPLPVGPGVKQGMKVTVPANSISFALGTSDGHVGDGRPRFDWVYGRGTNHTDYAIAYNISNSPLKLKVFAVDGTTDSTGSLTAAADNALRKGIGAWVKPVANYITIPAKRSVIIPLAISVPPNAPVGDSGGAVIVATIPSVDTKNGRTVIHREARIAMPTYVRVEGPLNTRIAFSSFASSFKATTPGYGDLTTKYTLVNTGNVRVSVSQVFALRGIVGVPSFNRSPDVIGQILPGSTYTGIFTVKHVFAGGSIKVTDTAIPQALVANSPVGKAAVASANVAALSVVAVAAATIGSAIVILLVLIAIQLVTGAGMFGRRRKRNNPSMDATKAGETQPTVGAGSTTGN